MRQAALQLAERYPNDPYAQENYIGHVSLQHSDREAMRKRYQELRNQRPDDVVARYLYARSLDGFTTPREIELLKQIVSADPEFGPAYAQLAGIYAFGKFADRKASREYLSSFYQHCPASLREDVLGFLASEANEELAKQTTPPLRERLEKETDPSELRKWGEVWTAEFKALPVTEYDTERRRIAADLARMEKIVRQPDAKWLEFLSSGYEQAGDAARSKQLKAELIQRFPASQEAEHIAWSDWSLQHPLPSGKDAAAKKAYDQAHLAFARERLKVDPNDYLALQAQFGALQNKDVGSPEEMANAAEEWLHVRSRTTWSSFPGEELQVARAYVDRDYRLDQVPALVSEGLHIVHKAEEQPPEPSDRFPAMTEGDKSNVLYSYYEAANILMDAGNREHRPELARDVMSHLEALHPRTAFEIAAVWSDRAKWAELNGHKLDALLMYREAEKARSSTVAKQNIARLWKDLGGTSEAFALLNGPAPKTVEAASESGWEVPKKQMLGWQLTALDGKVWRLKSLEGKTLLIDVWATWCGPCRAELPHVEKLYQKLKGDPSVQILSFNVDEEVGKVAPFVKQQGLTFPVLLAGDYVHDLIPELGIPQTWIVDRNGHWRWQSVGFATDSPDKSWGASTEKMIRSTN